MEGNRPLEGMGMNPPGEQDNRPKALGGKLVEYHIKSYIKDYSPKIPNVTPEFKLPSTNRRQDITAIGLIAKWLGQAYEFAHAEQYLGFFAFALFLGLTISSSIWNVRMRASLTREIVLPADGGTGHGTGPLASGGAEPPMVEPAG